MRRSKSKKTEFLSVRVSEETKLALQEEATSDERSLSWLVSKILEQYVSRSKSKSTQQDTGKT